MNIFKFIIVIVSIGYYFYNTLSPHKISLLPPQNLFLFGFFPPNALFPNKTELLPPQNPLLCNQEQHEVGQPPHCITAHNQTATAQYCNCTALLQYCYCTAQAVTCIPAAYILLL